MAEAPELAGCVVQDDTVELVVAEIQEAIKRWLDFARTMGIDVPEPILAESEYSGKFTLRIPRSLHKRLDYLAHLEGLSLNQYVLHLVSGASRPHN